MFYFYMALYLGFCVIITLILCWMEKKNQKDFPISDAERERRQQAYIQLSNSIENRKQTAYLENIAKNQYYGNKYLPPQ